jgi:hypothetical protein
MHDEIERILANGDTIAPSAGFLTSVMEAVEREAAALPPLAFPWSRALPGLLAAIAAFAVAIWHGIGSLRDPASSAILDEQLREFMVLATGMGLHWILFAVAITILSMILPLSLMRVRNSSTP